MTTDLEALKAMAALRPAHRKIGDSMKPSEAKAWFGATHYATMLDGVTPQMYYKQETNPVNDGTTWTCWVYLSFADLWMGSNIRIGSEEEKDLVAIDTGG
jgi:hypothetical protein